MDFHIMHTVLLVIKLLFTIAIIYYQSCKVHVKTKNILLCQQYINGE